ncbi:hypothetical protein BJ138DRAFT_1117169 [Hygrophoropsis aurantiaca]|uniref:Uncharacterized protein n=1 Tax=Hygrophoropsis aurantiaca TaxID=72124 RepID=A0ACB8A051_9AGAM|nr:hypothetical protein BJ138DRAFT_1117169 [Hygrophoropsis aurantiaca]
MPVPLPNNDFQDPLWREAYDKCLGDEANAADNEAAPIHARMLGYCMREAHGRGSDNIARAIVVCHNDQEKFTQVAYRYIHHFLRCFRSAKGRTPTPSTHPSLPAFDDTQQAAADFLKEPPTNHATAKHKALVRDRSKCMLTGEFDLNIYFTKPHLYTEGTPLCTEAAHIVSASSNAATSDEAERKYAAFVWDLLKSFGSTLSFEQLNGSGLHRLENIMTLCYDKHDSFDKLRLWLDSTVSRTPRTPYFELGYQKLTFTTDDPVNYPLPNPEYLRHHAAAARVAYMSGAGEYIERVLTDMEMASVLADDGSSVELLAAALVVNTVH